MPISKADIIHLIGENKTREVIDYLMEIKDENIVRTIALLSSRYENYLTDDINQVIKPEDLRVTLNEINDDILKQIDRIPDENFPIKISGDTKEPMDTPDKVNQIDHPKNDPSKGFPVEVSNDTIESTDTSDNESKPSYATDDALRIATTCLFIIFTVGLILSIIYLFLNIEPEATIKYNLVFSIPFFLDLTGLATSGFFYLKFKSVK